jgi:hypothetical protein
MEGRYGLSIQIVALLTFISDIPCVGNAPLLDWNHSHGGINRRNGIHARITFLLVLTIRF